MKHKPITDIELLAKEFPEPEWIIPDYLPEGYTLLAGLPKMGKSVIALQIAEAVGSGGMLFGKKVKQGNVLYISKEDGQRRLKRRLKENQHKGTGNIYFYDDWEDLDGQGIADLQAVLSKRKYRVLILDTFFRLFSEKVKPNDSASIVKALKQLHNLAKPDTGLVTSLIILDHKNKASFGADKTDGATSTSGSVSKTGLADTIWGVDRERRQKQMKIDIIGRDVEEQELEVVFDPLTKCYQAKPDVKPETMQADILKTMVVNVPICGKDIATTLNKQLPNVLRELGELEKKARVVSAGKGVNGTMYIKVADPLGFLNL